MDNIFVSYNFPNILFYFYLIDDIDLFNVIIKMFKMYWLFLFTLESNKKKILLN